MDYEKQLPPPRPDLFAPKLVSVFREGYTLTTLGRDAMAGLTVAVVALPLSMAIGIASGSTPAHGLVTAIVAGFIISALGGSRYQVGGPTAAFIVVVFATIERHGYDGLLLATLIAGLILLLVGFLRLGTYIRYIPHPVITGFTAGIAVSIFASQIKDLLGLEMDLPGEFLPKIQKIIGALPSTNFAALMVAILALATIVGLRIVRPRWPGFLVALVVAALVAVVFHLDVATVGSAFGGVPRTLPMPEVPAFDLAKIRAVLPDAFTIALLAGVESLLSAVVADGMTGRRHRSNVELVAQGVANLGSVMFAGLPATGAIARTATSIRAGARTPMAGILHAVFLLVFVLVAAPILSYVPLAALAAILAYVAWNISEIGHIRTILLGSSHGDRIVLTTTFLLTVLVDLTVAIEVGVVLAAIIFMHRMATVVKIETETFGNGNGNGDSEDEETPGDSDVVIYRSNGPFFFGAAQKLASVFDRIGDPPRAYILDLASVPLVDSTAARVLKAFIARAGNQQSTVILADASPTVKKALIGFGIKPPLVRFVADVDTAMAKEG